MHNTVKRTNHTLYDVDNTLAILLLEGLPDIFAKYEKPVPAPTPTTWGIGTFPYSGRRHILVCLDGGREIYKFIGPPEQIAEFEKSLPAVAGKCPDAVLARYTAEYVPYVS
jgi:hypothetical protein